MTVEAYDLSWDRSRVQLEFVHRELAASYWLPGIRRGLVERAINHSLVLGAYECASGAQVAFGRVITDFATFSYLCDVVVAEVHRGHGIGKRMVEAVLAHPELQSVRRHALATRDAHDLYRRYGFHEVEADRWMERKNPPEVWQDFTSP